MPKSDDLPEVSVEAAKGYEALFVPAIFTPWPQHVIAAAAIQPGETVLDVATGTGVLARACRDVTGPSGKVVGLDPLPAMLTVAAEVAPDIEWSNAPAENIGFHDGSFDKVVSQFGMMFFRDRAQAAREMLRVLKPNGRLGLAVWDDADNIPVYRTLIEVLADAVGAEAADAVGLPFSLGAPSLVTEPLSRAGFADIQASTVSEPARFPSIRTLVEAELGAWLPLVNVNLSAEDAEAILARAEAALAEFANADGEAVFDMKAHVFSARRP